VLLDRRRVKFWQKIVFGAMAVLMASFLIFGYSGVLNGCDFAGSQSSATDQLDQQITKYAAAVTTDRKDVAAWTSLAENYVLRANQQAQGSDAQTADWRQAVIAYGRADKLLAKQKGAAAKQQRLDTLEQLVGVHLYLQDYQSAVTAYGKITGLRPKDAQSFFDMGTVAINAGDTKTALLAFTRFLELDPTSPDAPAVKDWMQQNAPSPSPSPTKGSGQ